MGIIDARNGPAPTAAQLTAWFPDPFNVDTWNLAAISPLVRTYTIGVGDFNVPARLVEGRRVGAGRLEGHRQPDAEPRPAVGRLDSHGFANDVEVLPWQQAGLPERLHQLPAAPRLCLPADRPHGHPRRLGPLLRRRARRRFLVCDRQRADRERRIRQRRPRQLRARPDQRRGPADLRAGADHVLRLADPGGRLRGMAGARLHRRGALPDARAAGVPRPVRVRQRPADVADLDRRPAAVRRHDGGRGGLRLQPGTRREGRHRQRQPDVQPGDRRELSGRGSDAPRRSRAGATRR